MPFKTGAVRLGAIQDLWKRYPNNSSISFSDFYRTQNENNYHSEGLPITTSTSLSLSDFRDVPVPLAGDVDRIKASGNSSTTDIVASNQRFNPGIDLSTENAWFASGRAGGIPDAFTYVYNTYFSGANHYFFANSGLYVYFEDEDNPGPNDVGDFARVTLSTAYDITTPVASSYVDQNFNRVDLRTEVDANKPSSRHPSSTNSGTPAGTVPPCIFMKNDGTKIWGVALDMRWMSESFSSNDGDTLVQFNLSTPYDISTASYSTYHVFTDDNVKNSEIMGFSADGTVLLIQGQDYSPSNKRLNKYTLSSAWNISTISYSGSKNIKSINSNFSNSTGVVAIDFYQGLSSNKPTKAFFEDDDTHYSYNMNVTGTSPTFTLTGSTQVPGGRPFANGNKRIASQSNVISPPYAAVVPAVTKVLSLSTSYDLDTLGSYNPTSYDTAIPTGVTLVDGDINVEHSAYQFSYPQVCLCWSSDGEKVFYLGKTTSDTHPKIYTENCTTPWTLEGVDFTVSSTTNSNYPLPFTSNRQQALGIELNDDGTKVFVTYATYTSSGSFFSRTYRGYNYILEFDMLSQPVYAPYTIDDDGSVLNETYEHAVYSTSSSSNIVSAMDAYNLQTRFSPDGLSLLLITAGDNEDLLQKTLSTAYDITTANGYSSPDIGTSNSDLGLVLAKTGSGSFWSSSTDIPNGWRVSDVGIDGYSIIAQNPQPGLFSDWPLPSAQQKVVFRAINQDDSTLPNVVASLFSTDRVADGFLSNQGSAASNWSSGITSAGAAHSFAVKKEFVLNSGRRWPIFHVYKYLPNGSVLQFCSFLDDDVPNFFRIFTIGY